MLIRPYVEGAVRRIISRYLFAVNNTRDALARRWSKSAVTPAKPRYSKIYIHIIIKTLSLNYNLFSFHRRFNIM